MATHPTAAPAANSHHALAAHEVVLLTGTDPRDGLSPAEAADRLQRYGPNLLPQSDPAGPLRRAARQFAHPLIYILVVSGVITAVLGEVVNAGVIFGVVVLNAAVGYIQESKAEAALDALRSMVRTRARVVRGGRAAMVASEDLVPGDLVAVEAGDKVPADLRLLREAELEADESALTGESVPVAKDEVVLPQATPVADRRNMLYSSTLVTSGTGAGVVVATGADTELGEIHRLVGSARVLDTPLTAKLARFSTVLAVVILALAAVTFAVGLVRGEPPSDMFIASVALAVGAIPEGLPAAVTVTLAIGVARMARRRAVIRRLPAVETLGSTTVICTDKTGTLTENQMTVRAVWTAHGRIDVSGSGYAPEGALADARGAPVARPAGALYWCLAAGALCNDASLRREGESWVVVGDPTEGALLAVAAKAGLPADRLAAELPREAEIPFTSERRAMATLHRREGGTGWVMLAKGAVEQIVGRCDTQLDASGSPQPLDRGTILEAATGLAAHGYRVLATAVGHPAGPQGFDEEAVLSFAGLLAMQDPPRPAAAGAIRSCRAAGIDVKMITGDHATTAGAIAAELGLLDGGTGGGVVTGSELAALPPEDYPDVVARSPVFARVSPDQKLRLVESLQSRGHVVAMTGDGVNDAPALRRADIGVAMGKGGTEVAKEAADMVLTDDDFATIEAAVEEGRGVFDNLVKFIVWTLPTNMGEGLVILAAILVGTALPILPVQILWINMTTAVALGLMLAFEPKEPGIMARSPRDPRRPLLTGGLVVRIVLVSALLIAGSWWLFEWERSHGAGLAAARTTAVNVFVVVEALYLFSCRSLERSPWHVGFLANRWILAGVAVQAAAQAALTYVPAMNHLFGTAPMTGAAWLRVAAVGVVSSLVVAADKRWRDQRL